MKPPRWTWWDGLGLLIILAAALGGRIWYVIECADRGQGRPMFRVQGEPAGSPGLTEVETLAGNLSGHNAFRSRAPLAADEETTAHMAPGYPWLFALVSRFDVNPAAAMRWGQAVLGALTALLFAVFARRAFQSGLVGFLAGLGCALHPFYVVNVGEVADGVIATFLLASCLAVGARASQEGGALASLLFGLCLAALSLVRAAALPFALAALIWFLWRCRSLRGGWFAALLAFLGFANGLAPWMVRNWREFGGPVPVVTSGTWHFWLGQHPELWGSTPPEDSAVESVLGGQRADALRKQAQAQRYLELGKAAALDAWQFPGTFLQHRLASAAGFVVGQSWVLEGRMVESTPGPNVVTPPPWLEEHIDAWLQATLLVLILLALCGWRLSFPWSHHTRLLTLAALLLPLPYLLSHPDVLSGPRLPLDGVWICYAAYALGRLHPATPREPAD